MGWWRQVGGTRGCLLPSSTVVCGLDSAERNHTNADGEIFLEFCDGGASWRSEDETQCRGGTVVPLRSVGFVVRARERSAAAERVGVKVTVPHVWSRMMRCQ